MSRFLRCLIVDLFSNICYCDVIDDVNIHHDHKSYTIIGLLLNGGLRSRFRSLNSLKMRHHVWSLDHGSVKILSFISILYHLFDFQTIGHDKYLFYQIKLNTGHLNLIFFRISLCSLSLQCPICIRFLIKSTFGYSNSHIFLVRRGTWICIKLDMAFNISC